MKDVIEFKIDKWIQRRTDISKFHLYGSSVGTLTLTELQSLAPNDEVIDKDLPLAYGNAQGSLKLRERIAALHSSPAVKLTADNVVITPGSIMANYLSLVNLAGPGDHVICQYPTFSQLWFVPRFQGAEVDFWRLKRGPGGWEASLDELKSMIKKNTKAIIINNPNNPTGAIIPLPVLQSLITLAAAYSVTLYSDEVFSPLFHGATRPIPPLVSLGYPATISTGSVSKTIGLAGIRVGWIVSPDVAFLERVMTARDWTTISVSQLDSGVAAFALSDKVLPQILARNHATCSRSIVVLAEFVARNQGCVEWTPPAGAGTAFVRVLGPDGEPVDDAAFADVLVKETGVSVLPGGFCFRDGDEDIELKGYIRIGLGLNEHILREGLKILERFLDGKGFSKSLVASTIKAQVFVSKL
ncbi:pyridoxal phosphate-dependent transferase [Lasiosphaeris hirsuta]|uniref:Pyridoxal phosphate-dependent transferase n=1 Tax=Lasiosphaeris hirsuta TaxID=260670 RepID=A0AA40E093_9PEZI|nr:pyridoxal phosphate-dependent transferase [Lasiosphaeris hirsuta]